MAAKKRATKKTKKQPVTPAQPLRIMSPFPTDIGVKVWVGDGVAKLNDALRLAMYRSRIKDPKGLYRSNSAGTWHSNDNLLQWTGDAGIQLGKMYGECFRSFLSTYGAPDTAKAKIGLNAWGMIYSKGGYATAHTHPNCHMSGVYYVDDGHADEITMATGVRITPGDLEFVDTRGSCGLAVPDLNMQPSFRLTPKSGTMLVFPSWFPHFTHPVAEEERISIACNATVKEYTKEPK